MPHYINKWENGKWNRIESKKQDWSHLDKAIDKLYDKYCNANTLEEHERISAKIDYLKRVRSQE